MTRSDKYYRRFLDISVYLTGFDSAVLLGTGMAPTYFETTLLNSDPSDVHGFFEAVDRILAPDRGEPQIRTEITDHLMPLNAYGALARQIILLWYTGAWNNAIVSSESYKHGLMWIAAETHPAGAKQPGFGSWSTTPISLRSRHDR